MRTNRPEMAEILSYYLALPSLVDPSELKGRSPHFFELFVREPIKEDNAESISSSLVEAIHKLAVALNHRFLFIHGCAFSHKNETTIFCGASGSGKTTLSIVADHLGYPVLGEDIVVVDWKERSVYPILIPFKPRPFTRRLLERWYVSKDKTWEEKAPFRPVKVETGLPLQRLFFSGAGKRSNLVSIFESTFGHDVLEPDILARQIARSLSDCRIKRCPRVRIPPEISEAEMSEVFRIWMESTKMECPKEIFGKSS
ncbi:MAG: hypothetical protein K8R45_02840 [Desulfobacterales bacterium]|nr:hypothetical protein [Desulfobacterales bacterium]